MKSSIIKYLLIANLILLSHLATADPGDFYKQRHQEWVSQFDTDGDGFLNAVEREKMRSTPKPKGRGFRRGGERREKKEVRRDMPKHWIEKYDKDGDGGLSGRESEKGYWTERSLLFKRYDVNENEKLDPKETKLLAADIEAGKFESWDHFVATTSLKDAQGEERKSNYNLSSRQREWMKYDSDGDGIASEQEIAAIRNAEESF